MGQDSERCKILFDERSALSTNVRVRAERAGEDGPFRRGRPSVYQGAVEDNQLDLNRTDDECPIRVDRSSPLKKHARPAP
jgi:hypothetical protein